MKYYIHILPTEGELDYILRYAIKQENITRHCFITWVIENAAVFDSRHEAQKMLHSMRYRDCPAVVVDEDEIQAIKLMLS